MTTTVDRHQVAEFTFEAAKQHWDWSPSLFPILDLPASAVPSTALLMATKHPDDRPLTRRMLAEAFDCGGSFCYQSRVVRGDGHIRTLEATAAISSTSSGAPVLVGTIVPVSDWNVPVFEGVRKVVSEGHLAVALLARLEEAHTYVFRHYAQVVVRSSRQILHDRSRVDDVVQAVFEALWHHPRRFDPSRGSLATYLQMQARGRSLDLLRSESARTKRVLRSALGAASGSGPEDEVVTVIANGELRRALDLLPTTECAAIKLAYFENMTYQEVATHLGLPEGTVKSQIRSGLHRLRARQNAEASGQASNTSGPKVSR